MLLSQMIARADCPISDGIRNNLKAIKIIRDDVEHKKLGKIDVEWSSLFQACCLNFNKILCELFGDKLTLENDLSLSLQFSKMSTSQLTIANQFEIPEEIRAIDARLEENLTEEQRNDLEFRFRVIYTLDAASKSRTHFQFVQPESADGKEIRTVLVKDRIADDKYPHKASHVWCEIRRRTNISFKQHNHTQAWILYEVRPRGNVKQPENTKKEYCIYHKTHKDYTYTDSWVDFLVQKVSDPNEYEKILTVKV